MYKNLKSTYDYFDYNKLLDRDILPSTIQKSSNRVLTIDRHYKNFNSGIITRYCEHREDETKHLLYSNVNWNDIIYLDIKPITFTITSYWDPFYPSNKGKIVFRKSNFGLRKSLCPFLKRSRIKTYDPVSLKIMTHLMYFLGTVIL